MKRAQMKRRKPSKGMDVYHVCSGQQFCWNSEKADANLKKHGIRFEQACEVFFDPFVNLLDATPEQEARSSSGISRRLDASICCACCEGARRDSRDFGAASDPSRTEGV